MAVCVKDFAYPKDEIQTGHKVRAHGSKGKEKREREREKENREEREREKRERERERDREERERERIERERRRESVSELCGEGLEKTCLPAGQEEGEGVAAATAREAVGQKLPDLREERSRVSSLVRLQVTLRGVVGVTRRNTDCERGNFGQILIHCEVEKSVESIGA